MHKLISAFGILLIVILGFIFFKNKTIAPTELEENSGAVSNMVPVEGSNVPEMVVTQGAVREFVVESGSYYFAPKTLSVKEGETVKITLRNKGGYHDLKLDEFGVATKILKTAGEEDTVTFVASKKGTFQYYCSIGDHRQMGMVGTITVE